MRWRLLLVAGLVACGSGRRAAQPEPAPAPDAAPPRADRPRPGPPDGYVSAVVLGVVGTSDGQTVVLVDVDREWTLPIVVGEAEARAIRLRLAGERFHRPLTHDLLDRLLAELDGELEKVHVDDLRGDTFVGRVFVRQGDRVFEVDSRPSDAIALAIGAGAPIFAARTALRKGGLPTDEELAAPPARPGWIPAPVGDPL